MSKAKALKDLELLHESVDRAAAALSARHGSRLKCGLGCAACCVDDLTVFTVEAERIRQNHGEVLKQEPHGVGACAFLDEQGGCRVYEHRPYVCRTQGLPLRWVEEGLDEWVEYRDICPLNEEGEPLAELAEEDCWTLGEVEGRLAEIQEAFDPSYARTPLRGLFVTIV